MPAMFGKYEILKTLGEGGNGVVYKARQEGLDRIVALKVMNTGAVSPEAFARFQREMKVLGQLRHQNIVRLLSAGQHEGQAYLTMDFIDGRPLSDLIAEAHVAHPPSGVPLSPPRAGAPQDLVRHLAAVARAVQYAHEKGIIHRDLKPSNIIVDKNGEAVITDFGLAKELGADQTITAPGSAVGTALYMSPEQADGSSEVGPETDVYALGAILYEILIGRPPFIAPTAAAILHKALTERPAPPRRLDRSIPRDLETVCLKCLERSPADRYPTAESLAIDLEQYNAGRRIFAKRPGPTSLFLRRLHARGWTSPLVTAAAVPVVAVVVALALRALAARDPAPPRPVVGPPLATPPSERPPAVPPVPPPEAPKRPEALIDSYFDPNAVACIGASAEEAWWGVGGGAYRLNLKTGQKDFYPLKGRVLGGGRDAQGRWWFGTPAGAYCFDGRTWRTYALPNQFFGEPITVFALDSRGRPWFGGKGVFWYDGSSWKTHRWDAVRYNNDTVRCEHLAPGPDGTVWCAFRGNLRERVSFERFDGEAWRERVEIQTPYILETLVCDSRGRVWAASSESGVFAVADGRLTHYTTQEGLADNDVRTIAEGPAGAIWAGTEHGTSRFDGKAWTTYDSKETVGPSSVQAITADSEGRMWFLTNGVMVCYDGQKWTTHRPPMGGAYRIVNGPDGRLWFAGSGVFAFDGRTWTTYREERGMPAGSIEHLAVDRAGRKWVAGSWGAARLDRNTWTRLTRGWPGYIGDMMIDRQDRAWILLNDALLCLDGDVWRSHSTKHLSANGFFFRMAFGPDDAIWCAGSEGVHRFDGKTWTAHGAPATRPSYWAKAMAVDTDGGVWVVGDEAAWRLDVDGKTWVLRFSNRSSGAGNKCVAADPAGGVWIGDGRMIRKEDGQARRDYYLSKELPGTFDISRDGRPMQKSYVVRALILDADGWVWAGSEGGGLWCFDGTTWWSWTTADFLAGDDVTSLAVDIDGSIWAGTTAGLSHITVKKAGAPGTRGPVATTRHRPTTGAATRPLMTER